MVQSYLWNGEQSAIEYAPVDLWKHILADELITYDARKVRYEVHVIDL